MTSEPDSQKHAAESARCRHQLAPENGAGDNKDASVAHVSSDDCEDCKAEKSRRRKYRWKIIISLLMPFFVGNVDVMIVSPAFPQIASHFGKLDTQLNWIVTAYTLTSTSFIPMYGQIADIYGRHAALQLSMVFMVVGSTLAAAAQTWGMLLLGRAIQGMSAAGVYTIIKIVLADGVSLAENAKNNTIFALVGGISYSVGPVIGGYLTNASWRYCFVLSIPMALCAQIIAFVLVRKELKKGTVDFKRSFTDGLGSIDFLGAVLFIFGAGLIVLGITWGGAPYAWNSAAVVAPLVIGGALFIGFFCYEYLGEPGRLVQRVFPKQVPMIPWHLFSRKDAFLLCVVGFSTGAAMYSAFYFISIYWSLAEGLSPSDTGIQLLYYTPGIGAGAMAAMYFCNRWPRQTFFPILFGSVIEALGMAMLAWAVTTRRKGLVNGMLALAGGGTGLRMMPVNIHAVGIWPSYVATIISLMSFVLPFGGTIAMGIMGAVFTNKFAAGLRQAAAIAATDGLDLRSTKSLDQINKLPPDVLTEVRHAAARGVMWSFISILPLMGCSVVASLFMGNVWIVNQRERGDSGAVLYSSYIEAIFRGNVRSSREPIPIDRSENNKAIQVDMIDERKKPVDVS